jgi:hypothetical protein
MWLAETRAPTHCDRDMDNSMLSETFPTLYGVPYGARNSGNEPNKQTQKAPSPKSILHQNKTKEKQNVIVRWAPATTMVMATMMVMGSQRLVPGAMAGVIGPLHLLQDHAHRPQDITDHAWIPRDPRDRGHT